MKIIIYGRFLNIFIIIIICRKCPVSHLWDPIKKFKVLNQNSVSRKVFKYAQQHVCAFLDQLDHFPGNAFTFPIVVFVVVVVVVTP